MKIARTVLIIIQIIVGATILGVASILLLDRFAAVETVKAFVVMSASMEPIVKLGSVVVTRPQASYSPSDIITFKPDGNDKQPITHRVVFKSYSDGLASEPVYFTAGDANEELDRLQVRPATIVGRVLVAIPYLGYVVNFAKQPYGFILLVIVPATIVVYEELKNIWREIGRFRPTRPTIIYSILRRLRARGDALRKAPSINLLPKTARGFPKQAALMPVVGAALVFASFSSSFFSDIEPSTGNAFTAAESFISPGDVVINELMWMGSSKGASDEWIELRNMTGQTIDISGWQITKWVPAGGGSEQLMLTIPAGKSIAPNGFFLVAQFPSGDPGSALNVTPDVVSTGVTLHNSNLQVRLFISGWDTGGTLMDAAGDKGAPFAGEHQTSQPKKFYSMERNSSPGDGTLQTNWHTATTSVGFDSGEDIENRGTPRSVNSSP